MCWQEELERIKKILERAKAKAEGRLDLSGLLTEDNPDGCKFYRQTNGKNGFDSHRIDVFHMR